MPAVVVDSSVLISLAAGEQFRILRELYATIYIPPEVWNEVVSSPKPFGANELRQARSEGWMVLKMPGRLDRVLELPFSLQLGEVHALALALELPDSLLLVDDLQGRRAANSLGIAYTGTLGVLLRAKSDGRIAALRPILDLLRQRTTFWLATDVLKAALKQAGEAE
jgi:predicted nucleic acid-binding protein